MMRQLIGIHHLGKCRHCGTYHDVSPQTGFCPPCLRDVGRAFLFVTAFVLVIAFAILIQLLR